MKLGEALLRRSEYQTKIENLQSRILANIKVQEGDEPFEDPETLIGEVLELSNQLGSLIKKINARNNTTTLPSGQTISEALVERDILIKQRNLLSLVAGRAQEKDYWLKHTEVKMSVAVSPSDLQKEVDRLSKRFRELDTSVQEANWLTDLE